MDGLPAVVVGVLWYALFYLRHSTAPTAPFAEFQPPRPIGHIFRRGGGSLRLSALAIQLWAVALAAVGVLAMGEIVPNEQAPRLLLSIAQYGIFVVGAVWLLVIWFGRSTRK